MNRKRERRRERRLVARAAKFVRELFSTTPPEPGDRPPDDLVGGLGVREPRRPLRPNMSGAVALELPPSERTDVWAVGEDERG